jgi:predicted DCC family thiol-disulfide oxidoreductase YuxK
MHVARRNGEIISGGAAMCAVLRRLEEPPLWARILCSASFVATAGYSVVASRRAFWGRFVSQKRRRAADDVLSGRAAAVARSAD